MKELTVEGLAHFTAYTNKSIKVVFEDRTILRMMHGCDIVRILNKRGEEAFLNMKKEHSQIVLQYMNYIKVGEEFYEWAYSTPEER